MAKLPLRHYSWLHTLPLPGTHAGIGDRLGHEPGGVLLLPTHDMRFAHRTMPFKEHASVLPSPLVERPVQLPGRCSVRPEHFRMFLISINALALPELVESPYSYMQGPTMNTC